MTATIWSDCLIDDTSIRAIYKDSIPQLTQVEVHELTFSFDHSHIKLRVDLNDLPQPMPFKWAKFNTVQITLILNDVRSLSIQGWDPILVADIDMYKLESGNVQFELKSDSMHVKAEVDPVFISNFSAYLKGDD